MHVSKRIMGSCHTDPQTHKHRAGYRGDGNGPGASARLSGTRLLTPFHAARTFQGAKAKTQRPSPKPGLWFLCSIGKNYWTGDR